MTIQETTPVAERRWAIIAAGQQHEARLVARYMASFPQLGETTITELLTRELDAAARPIGEPGACPDLNDDEDRIIGWLDHRLRLRCLDATTRKRFQRDELDPTIPADSSDVDRDELAIIFGDVMPRLHENERRYLVALAACPNSADAQERLGWTQRKWRRWQASTNAHIQTLRAGGLFGVLPLPFLMRVWATMTPDRIAVATATGGAAASSTGTLLGGAGTAKVVAGIAALAAAAGGAITAEHRANKSQTPTPVVRQVPAAAAAVVATPRTTATTGAPATKATTTSASKPPPLATKKTATTDFKPAGGTAQKTRGGSSDFIPDGPTPVTKTYTPQTSSAASGGKDFGTP